MEIIPRKQFDLYPEFLLSLRKLAESVTYQGKDLSVGDTFVDENGVQQMVLDVKWIQGGDYILSLFDNDGKENQILVEGPKLKFPQYGVSFAVGDIKKNFKGKYVVKELLEDKNKIVVEYLEGPTKGEIQSLDASDQAKVIHNEDARNLREDKMKRLNLTGKDESFTLGLIAGKGTIVVMMPKEGMKEFEELYKRLTGDDAKNHLNNGYYERPSDGPPYFRVAMPNIDPQLISVLDFPVDPVQGQRGLQFNSRNLVLNLFRIGFQLGKNDHRAGIIRDKADDKEAFNRGLSADIKMPPIFPATA